MVSSKKFLYAHGILLILLLGFALRLVMVVQGQGLELKWDEVAYFNRAHRLIADFWNYRDVMRPPVYPFFLSLVFQTVGDLRFVVGVAQALLSTFLIALIYTLTRILFARPSVALLAALFTALYFEFLTLARIFMSETLFIVLSVLGMTIFFHALKNLPSRQRAWEIIFAGIFIALAALTRELLSYFAVLVLPIWLIAVSWKQPRALILQMAALVFGLGIVFVPWIARNWNLEQRVILSTMHSEIDLLRDNWRVELRAQGQPTRSEDGSLKRRVRKALAEQPKNARSLFVLTRAAESIIGFPTAWIQDKFTRLRAVWRPFALEARVVRLENVQEPLRGWLQNGLGFSAVALVLLGTLGMFLARDDPPKLLIGLYVVYSLTIFILTHYLSRFRLPLLILLMPYAALALVQILLWLRAPTLAPLRQHPVRAFAASVVLILFAILIWAV